MQTFHLFKFLGSQGTEHEKFARAALFWVIRLRVVAISYRRFGKTYRSRLQGSRIQEHSSHALRRGSLKSSMKIRLPDLTPCSVVEIHLGFGGPYYVRHQDRRSSEISALFFQTTRCNTSVDSHVYCLNRHIRQK